MDTFVLEAVDLGKLSKVIIGHDGKGFAAGWYLEKLLIKSAEDSTTQYLFDCDR